MMSDIEVTNDFNKNVTQFFANSNWQRQEIYRSYEYVAGHQITSEVYSERERKNKPITIVNLAATYVRAVAGSEVLKANQLDFISMDEQFDQEADIMGDSIEYVQYASSYLSERATARTDTATCGIGGTVTYLDMSFKNFIAGKPSVERIFPGFIFYDNSSRGSQINKKARWVGYADPVSIDTLNEYIESEVKKPDKATMGAGDFKAFLMSFSQQQNIGQIDFIYHYFWWEYDDIYDVANPFIDEQGALSQALAQDDDVANMLGDVLKTVQLDGKAAYWSLDKESYKLLNETVETIELLTGIEIEDLEYSKRKGKCFYRAQFAKGMLIKKSRSYTQGVHALNIMTGYFDEIMGIYYGLMRPMSQVQDALNISVSDFQSYARSAAGGGNVYIKGASESIERIIREKANEDAVTPIPGTAEVIPKETTNTPQVLIEFSRLMMELIPKTIGIPHEFMGMITTGDMTEALFGRVMEQTLNVLAEFANNSKSADIDQGTIFVELVKLMAEANDGMILPILSPGKKPENYFRLMKQNLAIEYAVRIVERPMTKSERQAQFNALSQLVPQYQAAGINIMPVLSKLSTLDQDLKDELVKLSTPQAPQPDPLNEALLDSQAKLQYATAKEKDAGANERAATLEGTIAKLQSEAEKNNAQTQEILASIGSDSAPLLKRKEMDLKRESMLLDHKHKMASLESDSEHKKATLTASSKPTVQLKLDAEDALGKVAETLAKSAENMEKMIASTAKRDDRVATATMRASEAMILAAKSIEKSASAPKKTVIQYNKQGRPIGAIQTEA